MTFPLDQPTPHASDAFTGRVERLIRLLELYLSLLLERSKDAESQKVEALAGLVELERLVRLVAEPGRPRCAEGAKRGTACPAFATVTVGGTASPRCDRHAHPAYHRTEVPDAPALRRVNATAWPSRRLALVPELVLR